MTDDLDPRILAQWLAGPLAPDEQVVLDVWLAAAPGHATQLQQARELWARAGEVARAEGEQPDDREAARWGSVVAGIRAGEQAAHATRPAKVRALTLEVPRRGHHVERWAAAAALILMAGGGLWYARPEPPAPVARAPLPMRTYETARGERAEFRLGDGTRVMLNVASRVRVPPDFGERTRDVYLEGGAYFEVVHDSTRPFAVHAGDILARDLGTEFMVSAYPEQPHARVVVRRGLVALHARASSAASAEARLGPGQQARLDDRGT